LQSTTQHSIEGQDVAKDLNWLTASQMAKGYKQRKFSPVEVTKAVLEQIATGEPSINAMCLVDETSALKAARASEKRWMKKSPNAPLDGVPVLIKDLLLTSGWPTLRGSKTIDAGQEWREDAPSVARLKEQGSVLIGKTTTPEFGWKGVTDSPLTGVTRNPWDLTRTPGGSSGGSAAAIAAGYGPLSLGTDGGGSIRIPAAFSGIFGLKPSFGRVPAYPLSPFGTVAHVGPMTRTVEDAALMMNAISLPDERDWTSLPHEGRDFVKGLKGGVRGLRIAFSPRLGQSEVEPQIARLVKAAVKSLADLGAKVEEVAPALDDAGAIFRVLWWSGVRGLLGSLPETKRRLLDPGLNDVLEQSKAISLEDYFDAVKQRGMLGSRMRQFMERYDLLMTPSLPIAAFEAGQLAPVAEGIGKWVDWTPFSYPFNLTQQPAASVPCGYTAAGLPAGLQIVGRMFDDWTVLRAAFAYEQEHQWMQRRPKLPSDR
jgi:aspartyl-tRNA(Asn)/glutamyl-tRNA(Gln) amidotransferase subunit A